MINEALYSSKTDEHPTPQWFFDVLNREFGFTLDPCATHENAKCSLYFTREDDGLMQDWRGHTVFMNPPYGSPEQPCKPNCTKKKCAERGWHTDVYIPGIIDWMRKAYESSREGATVVCLVPARTDTEWWHDYVGHYDWETRTYVKHADEVRNVTGRLRFGGAKNTAPFPSAVVIYRGKRE